jgi:hypothetical protein
LLLGVKSGGSVIAPAQAVLSFGFFFNNWAAVKNISQNSFFTGGT